MGARGLLTKSPTWTVLQVPRRTIRCPPPANQFNPFVRPKGGKSHDENSCERRDRRIAGDGRMDDSETFSSHTKHGLLCWFADSTSNLDSNWNGRPPMNTNFPSPAEHAMVMVEVCGDIKSAREIADINWEFATTPKEFLYWMRVASFLQGAACLAN